MFLSFWRLLSCWRGLFDRRDHLIGGPAAEPIIPVAQSGDHDDRGHCGSPWIEWVERLVHPRYWILSRRAADLTVGLACLVMSVFMFLRIPFGNTVPALSVIMMALSLSERDGLWLLGGFALSFASFAFVAGLFAAGAFAMMRFF